MVMSGDLVACQVTGAVTGPPAGGASQVPPLRAGGSGAGVALPAAALALLTLGAASFAAGGRSPWPFPARWGPALRATGLAAAAVGAAALAAWGFLAASSYVSARLSQWLDGVRPVIAEMSVFAAAYLVAASQRRHRHHDNRPFDDGRSLRDSMEAQPPYIPHEGGGGESERWAAAGVVFSPEPARATATGEGGGGGGREGSREEVEMPTRAQRDKGRDANIVPSHP